MSEEELTDDYVNSLDTDEYNYVNNLYRISISPKLAFDIHEKYFAIKTEQGKDLSPGFLLAFGAVTEIVLTSAKMITLDKASCDNLRDMEREINEYIMEHRI